MTEHKKIFQVDAFTEEAFKGNPAGVMFVSEEATEDWMQNIAREMNLSETAFIIPEAERFGIRFFTPTTEVALCGHATLAGSHIIYELGIKSAQETIEFQTQESLLTVRKEKDGIVMNFPRYELQRINIHPDFKMSLGFEALEMYSARDWIIAVAENEEEISDAQPDFERMLKNGLGNLAITSVCRSGAADFVVRCFAPIDGINEDPVTGSAHCALTPLWADKLGKTTLDSLQLSPRTGRMTVNLCPNHIQIKGKAVTVFEAQLKIR